MVKYPGITERLARLIGGDTNLQRKAEETKFKADQENQRAAQRLGYEYDKLAQQDEQSDERLEVAREKIQSK